MAAIKVPELFRSIMFEVKLRKSNYVGAYMDHKNDAVIVWERDANGKRVVSPYKAPYYFYVPDKDGTYTSITDEVLKRVDFDNSKEFEEGVKQHRHRFESDITPLQRILMDTYYGTEKPDVHYAMWDIEVDYNSKAYNDNVKIKVRKKIS